ncbi:MAG: NAD-dependent epimerase/dehydratase family protein [Acidobacteriota bacterium]
MDSGRKPEKILITGASGLLGRSLVEKFSNEGYFVFAHYYKSERKPGENRKWIYGDFSSITSIREFLSDNSSYLNECKYLINNYGPIIYKDSKDLSSDDLMDVFFSNVITVKEITDFLLKNTKLKYVMNIGFETLGEAKIYKKILSYAMGKNSLQLLTLSYGNLYPEIRFNMYSPVSLAGAEIVAKNNKLIEPEAAAAKIFDIMAGEKVPVERRF